MEESISLLNLIKQSFDLKEVDIRTYSPLTLAYIGDAVYDLIFRTVVVEQGNTSANKLHHKTIQYVKAPAQAVLIEAILEHLTKKEKIKEQQKKKKRSNSKNAIHSLDELSVGDYIVHRSHGIGIYGGLCFGLLCIFYSQG